MASLLIPVCAALAVLTASAMEQNEKLFTFKPGQIGLKVHASGLVKSIDEGGQASLAGVKAGWKFGLLDQAPWSVELLQSKASGHTDYVVTFITHEEASSPQTMMRKEKPAPRAILLSEDDSLLDAEAGGWGLGASLQGGGAVLKKKRSAPEATVLDEEDSLLEEEAAGWGFPMQRAAVACVRKGKCASTLKSLGPSAPQSGLSEAENRKAAEEAAERLGIQCTGGREACFMAPPPLASTPSLNFL